MGCNRLTKWWYLQVLLHPPLRHGAVTGLQNGGIYKSYIADKNNQHAVTGLQNGGIYKLPGVRKYREYAVTGLQNGGIYK